MASIRVKSGPLWVVAQTDPLPCRRLILFTPLMPCPSLRLGFNLDSVNKKKINFRLLSNSGVTARTIGCRPKCNEACVCCDYFCWHHRQTEQECDIFHHAGIFSKKKKQVESESQLQLLLVSSQEPLEVIIAEKEHGGNQSHLWHALSDNVVEMEISCSNRDENEFAGLISPATFPHRRGESRFEESV